MNSLKSPFRPKIYGLLAVLLSYLPCFAVSGIGAAVVNINGATSIRIYKVNDTHVDSSYEIMDNWHSFGNTAFPIALNTHGTHLAYTRWSGDMTNMDCWIGVVNIADPSKKAELVWYGADSGNAWGSKQVCWPRGDWIYFTTANASKYVYRVNVQTRETQFIAHINYAEASEFKMSTINNRICIWSGYYFTLEEIQASSELSGGQWPNGYFTVQGCGHTISASGNVMANQVDPGHFVRIITPLNWDTRTLGTSVLYDHVARNAMSVDREDPFLACSLKYDVNNPISGFMETVGVGQATKGNNFSINSDKWECTLSGWYPGGRELGSGGNFILWNPFDSIALNVTRLPRRLSADERALMTGTCESDPNATNYAGFATFLLTEPAEDILPELRPDLTTDYTVPGVDDNTQFPALTMLPKTPEGGWPINIVSADDSRPLNSKSAAPGKFKIIARPSVLAVDFGNGKAVHSISVFNVRGSLVCQRTANAHVEAFTASDGINPGVYVLKIASSGRTATLTATVR